MSNQVNLNLKTSSHKGLSRKASCRAAQDYIQNLNNEPYPNSEKIFIKGELHLIQVVMRKIHQADTLLAGSGEQPAL